MNFSLNAVIVSTLFKMWIYESRLLLDNNTRIASRMHNEDVIDHALLVIKYFSLRDC